MKYLAPLIVGMLLIPSFTYAATPDRHTLLLELISLIQQEITQLEAQLAAQTPNTSQEPVLSPSDPSDHTGDVQTLIHQLGTTVEPQIAFDAFIRSVNQNETGTFVNVESNKPLTTTSTTFTGAQFQGLTEEASNSLFRNTQQTSYQYQFKVSGVTKGVVFEMTIVDTDGDSLTKQAQL